MNENKLPIIKIIYLRKPNSDQPNYIQNIEPYINNQKIIGCENIEIYFEDGIQKTKLTIVPKTIEIEVKELEKEP